MMIDSGKQHDRMLKTPIPKLVTSLALPMVASQLITVLYNTADTYIVSQIGTSAAAAVGVVFSLMSIIQAVGYGISMGASSLISRCLGAKQDEDAHRYASSAYAAAILFGLLLIGCCLPLLDPLMRVLGATDTILPYALSYAGCIVVGAPIMCSAFVLSGVLRSEGESFYAMWGLCAGGLINIALDPLFIYVMDMGIFGAALATVLSQLVSFLILLSVFLRNKSIVKLRFRFVSRHIGDYGHIFAAGVPTIFRQGCGSIASALLNISAAGYGDAAVAAITIANKIYMLVRNIVIGIGQGFQPVAGYNFGAGNRKRVRQAFRYACVLGTGVCVAAAALIAANAAGILAFFRHDDADVIRIGTQTLYYVCAVMPLMAYSTFTNQLYQCLGFAKEATLLACCRQGIFFVPLILLLPRLIGLSGVQMTQATADLMTFLISVPFQIIFFRRRLKASPEPHISVV